jgi:hypothetical protein
MKKNIKILIFSLIGLLVLGATLLVLYLTREVEPTPEPPPPEPDTSVVFTNKTADDIEFIHISNHRDTGYSIMAKDDGTFVVSELEMRSPNVPYNQGELIRIAANAANITARSTVEENAENLSQYGFDAPRGQIEIIFKDGETLAFFIGGDTPLGSDIYFKLFNSDDIFAVPEITLSPFMRERHHWVIRQAFPDYDSHEAPTIDHISITRSDLDEPIIIEALPIPPLEEVRTFNSHKLVSPFSVEINQEKAMAVLFGAFGLTASEVSFIAPEESDLELAGLNQPFCIIEIKSGSEVYTLTIGTILQDLYGTTLGWYGMSSYVPEVLFLFSPGSLPWVYLEPANLIAEMFLTPYIHSLARVEITAGETSLNIAIADELDNFRDLYQFLISARGEELFMEELPNGSQLIAKITYVYKDESMGFETVEFYTAENLRSIIRLNGVNVFKTRDLYTARLLENIQAYINGSEIRYDW